MTFFRDLSKLHHDCSNDSEPFFKNLQHLQTNPHRTDLRWFYSPLRPQRVIFFWAIDDETSFQQVLARDHATRPIKSRQYAVSANLIALNFRVTLTTYSPTRAWVSLNLKRSAREVLLRVSFPLESNPYVETKTESIDFLAKCDASKFESIGSTCLGGELHSKVHLRLDPWKLQGSYHRDEFVTRARIIFRFRFEPTDYKSHRVQPMNTWLR